jgi:hypothetical protein
MQNIGKTLREMTQNSRWRIGRNDTLLMADDSCASERGAAATEFVLILPILLLIIAGIMGFGQLLYTKLAVEGAAWSGARHAVATLKQDRGIHQAYLGARYALDGFGLNADKAKAYVLVWGQWKRGVQTRARVCYTVQAPPVPLGEVFVPQQICATQTLPVYKWKSKW